jgi:hypothetical protein
MTTDFLFRPAKKEMGRAKERAASPFLPKEYPSPCVNIMRQEDLS